jgi:hypothetical protein
MSSLSADPHDAAVAAAHAAGQLDEWLLAASKSSYDEAQLRQQLVRFAQEGPRLIDNHWDSAAQLYLALAAFQQARLDVRQRLTPEDEAIRRLLGDSRQALRRPAGRVTGDFIDRLLDMQQRLTR